MADVQTALDCLEAEDDVFVTNTYVAYEEAGLVEAVIEVEIVDEEHPRRRTLDG